MRILDRANVVFDLEKLGFRDDDSSKTFNACSSTGPTASSSSPAPPARAKPPRSTPPSSELNEPREQTSSPSKTPSNTSSQASTRCQVNADIGLTFAAVLRSMLRQDPDIIMVGEIRDKETATIAVQASLTGHLVFSTLHTNDALGAITRLIDIGVEPFLVASPSIGVIAQRLVRKICPGCKQPYDAPDEVAQPPATSPAMAPATGRARAAPSVSTAVTAGGLGMYEIFEISPEARRLMEKERPRRPTARASANAAVKPLSSKKACSAAGLVRPASMRSCVSHGPPAEENG